MSGDPAEPGDDGEPTINECVAIDRAGIAHVGLLFPSLDRVGCDAWCSDESCLIAPEGTKVNCMLCIAEVLPSDNDDDLNLEPDDELDAWAPDSDR